MTTEVFRGTPTGLQARLAVIIGGAATINWVLLTHIKGEYIIAYT